MGMAYSFPGLDGRLRARLLELEYVKKGRADYRRFALEHGTDPVYLWRWVNGKGAPSLEAARKLAADLEVSLAWLLLGDEGSQVAAPTGPQDSSRIHARARAVGRPRVRGRRGPLPVGSDLDGVVSYRTLARRRRKSARARAQAPPGRENSRGAAILPFPKRAA